MRLLWAFFQVSRPHAAGPAAFIFLVGPVVATGSMPPARVLAALWVVGVLSHTFACVVNDIADRDADRANPSRELSPLVTGTMGVTAARVFALIQFAGALAIAAITPGAKPGYVISIAVLLLSVAFSNAYQKRRILPPIAMDILFGINLGAPAVLTTMWLTGAPLGAASAVGAIFGLHMVLLNVVGGNLKDLEHDRRIGDATTALDLHVRILNGRVATTARYRMLVTVVAAASLLLLVATAVQAAAPWWTLTAVSVGVVVALQVGAGVSLSRLMTGRKAVSPTGRESYIVLNFLSLIVACMGFAPLGVVIVAGISVLWTSLFAAVARIPVVQPASVEGAHVH